MYRIGNNYSSKFIASITRNTCKAFNGVNFNNNFRLRRGSSARRFTNFSHNNSSNNHAIDAHITANGDPRAKSSYFAFISAISLLAAASLYKKSLINNSSAESAAPETATSKLIISTPQESHSWRIILESFSRSLLTTYTGLSVMLDYKISLRGLQENSEEYKLIRDEVHLRSAKKMLHLAKKLGGFFTKFGQHLVSLAPAIPKQYTGNSS
jgi:hypothetical protein